jgi:hypothetical protein
MHACPGISKNEMLALVCMKTGELNSHKGWLCLVIGLSRLVIMNMLCFLGYQNKTKTGIGTGTGTAKTGIGGSFIKVKMGQAIVSCD